MKLVVTSVCGEENAGPLRLATCQMEDWLNAALSGADFGSGLDQVTVVVVSIDDDVAENDRWAKPHNKLGRFTKPGTSSQVRNLSFAVSIPPSVTLSLSPTSLLAAVAAELRKTLGTRPARVPSGFAYDRFSAAACTALLAYADAA